MNGITNTTVMRFLVISLLYQDRIDEAEEVLEESVQLGWIYGETKQLYDELVRAARTKADASTAMGGPPSTKTAGLPKMTLPIVGKQMTPEELERRLPDR